MSNDNNNYGMIDPITNAIGMAYNIGTGIFNSVQNYRNNQWNQRFAREQFDYQKDLNQILMDREDNAVQRRAKDLQAAGISKNLAAGSPAQAATMSAGNSGAVANSNMQTQQLQKMDIMNGYAQYQMVMAEKELKSVQAIVEAKREGLIDEQIATEQVNQIVGQAQARNLDANTEFTKTKNKRETNDYELDKERGTKSNEHENSVLTSIRSFDNTVVKFLHGLLGTRDNSVPINQAKDNGIKINSESELMEHLGAYAEKVYSKYGSLNSSQARSAFLDNFYKAYYDFIPGKNASQKKKWLNDNIEKARW